MKKFILGLVLASSFSVSANDLPPLNELIEDPDFQEFKETLEQKVREMHENYLLYTESLGYEGRQIVPFGSAAPLTYLEIRAVLSDQYPSWDLVNEDDFVTKKDHSGQFYVMTVEYGYANFNSRVLQVDGLASKLKLVKSVPIVGNLGYVIGYKNYWFNPSTNFENGLASYSAWSVNFPHNHEFDRVYIQ